MLRPAERQWKSDIGCIASERNLRRFLHFKRAVMIKG